MNKTIKEFRLFIVMGVAGCGKSTFGTAIADALGGIYLEGDEFHSKENIAKMSSGSPLQDEDRWPWLKTVSSQMAGRTGLVFTGCSALKRSYRDYIEKCAGEPVCFLFLDGSRQLISDRMAQRSGHFMPTALLESQFVTLERPTEEENAIIIPIDKPVDQLVQETLNKLADR